MEYFTKLYLKKEPFAKTADPDFFYGLPNHLDLLQKLESAIRLRKGLSVVIGDVGIGKTTLCLQLLKQLGSREDLVEAHLIADPSFTSIAEFLGTISATMGNMEVGSQADERELKDGIKEMLYRQVVEKEKVVVLVIDDGQKLPGFCHEVLRELLNYETNSAKLLQVVIFARPEFSLAGGRHPGLADRIANSFEISPLGFSDTRNLIRYRLQRANDNQRLSPELFTFWAQFAIYRVTDGYPRKIVMLCAKTLENLVNRNGRKVTVSLVMGCTSWMASSAGVRRKKSGAGVKFGLALLLMLLLAIPFWNGHISFPSFSSITSFFHERLPAWQTLSSPSNGSPPSPRPQPATHTVSRQPIAPPAEQKPAEAGRKQQITEALSPPADSEPPARPQKRPTATAVPPPEPAVKEAPEQPTATSVSPEPAAASEEGGLPALETRPLKLVADRPMLGTLRTGEGDVLSKMIARIYGRFNEPDLAMVLRANPWIGDINAISTGSTVLFPANIQPYALPSDLKDCFWLQLAEFDTLNEAYPFLRAYPESLPPILLVPFKVEESGLSFKVVLESHFHSEQQAESQMKQLPESFKEKAVIFNSWPEGTAVLTRNLGNCQ